MWYKLFIGKEVCIDMARRWRNRNKVKKWLAVENGQEIMVLSYTRPQRVAGCIYEGRLAAIGKIVRDVS